MFTKRIFWQLLFVILLIVTGSLISLGWIAGVSTRLVVREAVQEIGGGPGISGVPADIELVDRLLGSFYRRIALGGLVVASLAAALSFAIARRVSRPIEEIYRSAERLTKGYGQTKLPVTDSTEIGALAETINRLSLALDERLRTTVRQSREQEAILSSMAEGILVVDVQRRIVRANEAALNIMGLGEEVVGHEVGEVLHHAALKRMIETVLEGGEESEADLVLGRERDLRVEARGTSLVDSFERPAGALIVLNDRTRIHRLESLRRDFAAHVSHELKTPLTAIKGFADTLLRGALSDRAESERFIGVIADQAEQMERLVEQLLELARLERDVQSGDVERSWEELAPVLDAAVELLRPQAKERKVALRVEHPDGIVVRANATLLERALVNLVDNAIRHGGEGTAISLAARADDEEVVITVEDDGPGIAPHDCERIFERFYRTKAARSGDPGGSGLGLALVKHIALAHGGMIEVSSQVGVGSLFRLRIPRY